MAYDSARPITHKQIARRLQLSPRTIESHIGQAVKRLDAPHRAHAVAVAIRANLLDEVG